ncbi:hypothetical protein AQUCO_01000442v1 [Aquilegia coerulea]|uniref:Uncharacterized protein n=1 Tax=Aquilegia coerulea TaxID=218851 RepID=A0A2G5EAF6_AQUCA|nr:hypothetical protein AQUCO_01000442v1 [Aquilegia coerulea]
MWTQSVLELFLYISADPFLLGLLWFLFCWCIPLLFFVGNFMIIGASSVKLVAIVLPLYWLSADCYLLPIPLCHKNSCE